MWGLGDTRDIDGSGGVTTHLYCDPPKIYAQVPVATKAVSWGPKAYENKQKYSKCFSGFLGARYRVGQE